MTTLEEARRCPHCKNPGQPHSKRPAPGQDGGVIHSFVCMNKRCRWGPREGDDFGESWFVQVRPDGTIPERTAADKEYSALTPGQKAVAQATLEQIRIDEEVERAGLAGQDRVEVDEQAIADDIRRVAGG
jgi:hypothetical protein